MAAVVWCICIFLTCCGQIGCQSVCQQEQQLIATTTEQFITSPGYPNNYDSNLNCSWRISTVLQRCPHAIIVEVRRVELVFLDTLIFTSDYTHIHRIWQSGVYVFPGVFRVLFRTGDFVTTEKGFNISYRLEGLNLTTSTTVYGCQTKALLADVQSKEILMIPSNYSEDDIRGPCYWLVYVTDPCLTINEGTRQVMELVVEEFTSHGPGTIYISHQNHSIMTIDPKSALLGRSLHFYMKMNEVVLISFYGEYSGKLPLNYKISYKLVSTVESSECTFWFFSTITIGVALLLSVIAHVLVCLICRKRLRTKTKVVAINMEMSTKETKLKKTKRPYINMGEPVPDLEGEDMAREATQGILYEIIDDLENVPGQDALYENPDSNSFPQATLQTYNSDNDDADDYENIQREDYINAFVFSKRDQLKLI